MTPNDRTPQTSRPIDLQTYPRRRLYEAFRHRTIPVFSITTSVDITRLRQVTTSHQLRFFSCLSFLIAQAANAVPEFRHRIVDDQLVEFECVHPSLTVLLNNDTFGFADATYTGTFATDYRAMLQAIEQAKMAPNQDTTAGRESRIFLTNLPWFRFSSIEHPYEASYASIPIISTGQFHEDAGRIMLPVGIQVHHGLVDGLHVGRFVQRLSAACHEPETLLIP
jgi:chloramphenicol O-acetyltransferase type A